MKKLIIDNYIFFLLPFFAAYFAALYLVLSLQFFYGDALSRSFHAYAVFFANEPKFANIGFVWPPFPTLLALPLTLIKPLNLFGFSGNLLSAVFLGITSLFLNKIFLFFNISLFTRIALMLLFIFNPMMLFYGANGMSEMIGICFLVATLFYFLSYLKSGGIGYLIATSLATSLAVMTRYEMAALIPVIILLLVIISISKSKWERKNKKSLIERDLLLYGAPIAFTLALWVFANWAIMHNPFYFMTSVYSNVSQAGILLENSEYYRRIHNDITSSILYVGHRVVILFPAFIILLAVVLTKVLRKHNWILTSAILALPFSILFFHVFLLYNGQSYGWLRFFIYIIPASYILSALIISYYMKSRYYKIIVGLVLTLNLFSSYSTYLSMSDPRFGVEEYRLVNAITTQNTELLDHDSYVEDLTIADYLTNNITTGKVIVDDFTGFSIIYLSGKPELFIETIDKDFEQTLKNVTSDKRVHYILVPKPEGTRTLDAINRMYPTMFDNGANIAVLVKDFGKWRLYKKINT